jgi:hypothetical protein
MKTLVAVKRVVDANVKARVKSDAAKDNRRNLCGLKALHLPQHLTGVVDFRAVKPARARHARAQQDSAVLTRGLHVEIVPHCLPKRRDVGD